MHIKQRVLSIESKIKNIQSNEMSYQLFDIKDSHEYKKNQIIYENIEDLSTEEQRRIKSEFEGLGPIDNLLTNDEISEIIINGPQSIWIETSGRLRKFEDEFSSIESYQRFINKICELAKINYNLDTPMADGHFDNFRIHLVSEALTKSNIQITLRKHPNNPWTFDSLKQKDWAPAHAIEIIKKIVLERKNFLIIGETGSGKTSLINSCLQFLNENERTVLIEDTSELSLPNDVSTKLITRFDIQGVLKTIDQMELVKQSLRMRPDRIVLGEIRGVEAKDFLMALSTGHEGSFGSIHAKDPRQALIRLEMLIQLGAPYWTINAIRTLIFLSLHYIICVGKDDHNQRKLNGIYQLTSIEESGILIDRIW